ncbi:MAG: thiolase domain-containing protein [Coriobacteriia bacterium]|nr:thiolase domain-containing protein [Coriobacteriia bacterium]
MNCYVIGAGKTRFGPSSRTMPRLAHEAILGALDDAGISIEDIGAFVVANFLGGPNESQLHLNSVIAGLFPGINRPGWRVEAACASGGAAVHQAALMLGAYDPILVVGIERLSGRPGGELTRNIGMAGDVILDQSQGLNFPATYALVAQRHMQRYGTQTRDFELISLKNHANAQLNPLAHFHHKRVTQADIDAGVTVAAPLRLFDCCPVSDGAAAVILSAQAKDDRSVPLIGTGLSTDVISLSQRTDHTSFVSAREAARMAYEQAGITAAEVDFAEVHDCFTIAEIVAMEDLGLALPGEAVELIRAGETGIEGEMPVNPSGGLKAGGHAIGATGVSQIYEACTQLRGEAGKRQVPGARVAVTHNVGGVGGTCAVQLLGRPS